MTKHILLALAVSLSACGGKPAQVQAPQAEVAASDKKPESNVTVTFGKPALKAGQKFSQTTKFTATFNASANAGSEKKTIAGASLESEAKSEEILVVTGEYVTKVRIVYGDVSKKMTTNGEDKVLSVISGKTYVLEWAKGETTIKSPKGKAVPADEAALVKSEYTLGGPDAFAAALSAHPIKVGENLADSLTPVLESFAKLGQGGIKMKDVSFTLKEPKGDEAVFDVKMNTETKVMAGGGGAAANINIDLLGTATTRVSDSSWTAFNVSGPLTMHADMGGAKVEGSGKFEMVGERHP